jgi:hypothetical protein
MAGFGCGPSLTNESVEIATENPIYLNHAILVFVEVGETGTGVDWVNVSLVR